MTVRPNIDAADAPTSVENADVTVVGGAGHVGVPLVLALAEAVLRSTVFPGTTDWLTSYLLAKGRRLKVAFCPERVVQGNGLKELCDMPQIVSGTTLDAEVKAPLRAA